MQKNEQIGLEICTTKLLMFMEVKKNAKHKAGKMRKDRTIKLFQKTLQ